MNPSRLIPILGIMICLALSAMVTFIANAVRNVPVREAQPNVFFTPLPTMAQEETHSFFDTYIAPSETPTPLNYGALPITQTAAALESVDAAAQATIASAGSTQVAVSKINDGATATAQFIATDLANAQATNDRILRDQAEQERQAKAEHDRVESEAQARATLAVIFEYVWKVGGSIILVLGICLGMAYIFHVKKLQTNRKAAERVTANFLDNLSPVTVQVSTYKHSGVLHTVNITPPEMLVLRQAVIDLDGCLSRSKIVDGKYFPERRWNALSTELVEEDAEGVAFFERDSRGIHPTEGGYKFLGLPVPAPPLAEKSIETVEFPAIPVTERHVTGVSQAENTERDTTS